MRKLIRKEIAVFCSVLIVFAIFNFALIFNTKEVSAANVDTCGLTYGIDGINPDYCVEVPVGAGWEEYGGCVPGHIWPGGWGFGPNAVEECQLGTCIPSGEGACLSNVQKVRCNELSGVFRSNEDFSFSDIPECKLGCCKIYDSSCSLKEKKVCLVDFNGDYLWAGDDEQSCNEECSEGIPGCYIYYPGNCEYGTLSEFQGLTEGTFWQYEYCSDVVGCPTFGQGQTYLSCGDETTDDDVWDVYWYDSDGNREDLAEECISEEDSAPESMCDDPDGILGNISGKCVTTNCVDYCANCYPEKFRSGESVCVNVLGGFFANKKKSTGLQNYELTCQNRVINPVFSEEGEQRIKRCNDHEDEGGRFNTYWEDSSAADCHGCGGGGQDWIDPAAYAPLIGPGILALVGDACEIGGVECEERGECEYDKDIWNPIGSCNAEHPVAGTDDCSKCGGGGDAAANFCTQKECNALGDCQFEGGEWGWGPAAGLILGTFVSCMGAGAIAYAIPVVGPAAGTAIWGVCIGTVSSLNVLTLLYWGAVSLVYTLIGDTDDEETYKLSDDIEEEVGGDKKIKIGYALVTAKAFLEGLNESTYEELKENFVIEGVFSENATETGTFSFLLGPVTSIVVAPVIVGLAGSVYTAASFADALVSVLYPAGSSYLSSTTTTSLSILLGRSMVGAGLIVSYLSLAESLQTGNCIPEEAYSNSDHCEDCGSGEGQWYCTEDRCDILGGGKDWCQYINFTEAGGPDAGIEGGLCLPSTPNDHDPPQVEKIDVEFLDIDNNSVYADFIEDNVLEISGEIDWEAVYLDLEVTISQEGRCAYSLFRDKSYDESTKLTPDETYKIHEGRLQLDESDKIRDKVYVYIKCKDYVGNEVDPYNNDNYISFSFSERPDEEPPTIDYIAPIGIALPEGTEGVDLRLFAYDNNGVEDCRYSKENGTSYVDMTSFSLDPLPVPCSQIDDNCQKFFETFDLTVSGWGETFGDVISENITSYPLWILCSDTQNNTMYDPFIWSLQVWPGFNFTIESPLEDEEIWGTSVQISVNSGERQTSCEYTLVGGEETRQHNFSNAFTTYHSNTELDLNGTPGGLHYDLSVTCVDFAGNEVIEAIEFYIYADEEPPRLMGLWTVSNQLYIKLDETSTCYYKEDDLDFDFGDEDSTLMISMADGKEHSLSFEFGSKYGIRCRDEWDNEMSFIVYP